MLGQFDRPGRDGGNKAPIDPDIPGVRAAGITGSRRCAKPKAPHEIRSNQEILEGLAWTPTQGLKTVPDRDPAHWVFGGGGGWCRC